MASLSPTGRDGDGAFYLESDITNKLGKTSIKDLPVGRHGWSFIMFVVPKARVYWVINELIKAEKMSPTDFRGRDRRS